MKDAYGGILNLVFIVFFLMLVEGILGFIVIYTKAFKMKTLVISTIEEYEALGCGVRSKETYLSNNRCNSKIIDGAKSISYSNVGDLNCSTYGPSFKEHGSGLFCYSVKDGHSEIDPFTKKSEVKTRIYTIITQMDLNIPIINKVGLKFFRVGGDTREIKIYK